MASFPQALAGLVPTSSYKPPTRLAERRREVDGKLAVDLLLPPKSSYPASSADGLVAVVSNIEQHLSSRSAQARALYYIFLDCGADVAGHFASEVRLSEAQQHLVRGLWALDRHQLVGDTAPNLSWPWEFELTQELPVSQITELHRFVVAAFSSEPLYVVAYVDAKCLDVDPELRVAYSRALVTSGMYSRALDLYRATQDASILESMARAVISPSTRTLAKALANLPFSPDEWEIIAGYLQPDVRKDPSGLAAELLLVRALHVGDLPMVHDLKALDERYEVLAKGVADL